VLCDEGAPRAVVLKMTGFEDVVVWNPWIEKSKNTKDFGDEEYKEMVCLEAANAAVHMSGGSIEVPAGGTWTGSQQIYVRPLPS
jgi:D-hexose-6-phosphate mutarotase